MGRLGLSGNRQGSARRHTHDLPQEVKNHRILTAEQKEHNHLANSTRVRVEHSIGRLKRYARLADPYDGTISQFNHEFNVITGLVNLHLLWDKIDKGPPSLGRWGTSIDWSGAVPSANGAPF